MFSCLCVALNVPHIFFIYEFPTSSVIMLGNQIQGNDLYYANLNL
jgi:hypothetical protein